MSQSTQASSSSTSIHEECGHIRGVASDGGHKALRQAINKTYHLLTKLCAGAQSIPNDLRISLEQLRRRVNEYEKDLINGSFDTNELARIHTSILLLLDKVENSGLADTIPLEDRQPQFRTGRPPTEAKPKSESRPNSQPELLARLPLLRLQDCSKKFSSMFWKRVLALHPISLDIPTAGITAIVGPNAAGKSTLLKIMLGELSPSTGRVEYPGLPHAYSYRTRRQYIGYVPQFPSAWKGGLRDNLIYFASIRGLGGIHAQRRASELIFRFRLEPHLDNSWRQLSGGTRLKFALARELMTEPQLLILDEPLAHLDIRAQSDFLETLLEFSIEGGRLAVVMTSQHLYETESVATQIAIIRDGRLAFLGPGAEISRLHRNAYFEVQLKGYQERSLDQLQQIVSHVEQVGATLLVELASTDRPIDATLANMARVLTDCGVQWVSLRDITSSARLYFEDWIHLG